VPGFEVIVRHEANHTILRASKPVLFLEFGRHPWTAVSLEMAVGMDFFHLRNDDFILLSSLRRWPLSRCVVTASGYFEGFAESSTL